MRPVRQHWVRWAAGAVAVLAVVTVVALLTLPGTPLTPRAAPATRAAASAALAACTPGPAPAQPGASRLSARPDDLDGAAQLPASSGLRCLNGMTEIILGQSPLWTEKDGYGPYSPQALGLSGSLGQGFALTSAVRKFGALYHGLTLPLPSSFTAAHPGPAEVFDNVWAMRDGAAARMVMNNPAYNNGQPPMATGGVHGGPAWSVWSQANGDMQEFMFEFVSGRDLVQVNVIGAQLTLPQAQHVAAIAGPQGPGT